MSVRLATGAKSPACRHLDRLRGLRLEAGAVGDGDRGGVGASRGVGVCRGRARLRPSASPVAPGEVVSRDLGDIRIGRG